MNPSETGQNDAHGASVFGPVLQEILAGEGMRWTADFFRAFFKDAQPLPRERLLRVAAEKALKRFLILFADELENAGAVGPVLTDFIHPLSDFVRDGRIARILGTAFDENLPRPDAFTLQHVWESDFPLLPPEFDWSFLSRRYCREVRADLRQAPILRKTLSEGAGALAAVDAEAAEAAVLAEYRDAALARFSRFRPKWIPGYWLPEDGLPLHRLFIPPLLREVDVEDPESDPDEPLRRLRESLCERPPAPATVLINDRTIKHATIAGPPGSGKSMLLRHMALAWARAPLENADARPIPIFADLETCCKGNGSAGGERLLSGGDHFLGGRNDHRRHEYLKNGRVLLLADLNRVKDPGARQDAVSALGDLARTFPDVRIFVTAQGASPSLAELRAAGFRLFELQAFDERRMFDFIDQWLAMLIPDAQEKERKRHRLGRMLRRQPGLRKLCKNPGLLGLMTTMEAFHMLPDQRTECVEEVSRMLLRPKEGPRNAPKIDVDAPEPGVADARAVLARIAEAMTFADDGQKRERLSAADVKNILVDHFHALGTVDAEKTADRLISQMKSHGDMLQERDDGLFAFVHPCVQDYFAARAVIRKFQQRGLPDGMDWNAVKMHIFDRYATDASHRRVLTIIAEMLDAGFLDKIIRHLFDRAGPEDGVEPLFLAAGCLAEARKSPDVSAAKLNVLNSLNLLLMGREGDDIRPGIGKGMQVRALNAIMRILKTAPGVLDWLKDMAITSPDAQVKGAAMAAILRYFACDQAACSWLQTLAASEEKFELRLTALAALARLSPRAAAPVDAMKSMLAWSTDGEEKAGVIRALGRCRRHDPDIISLLCRASSSSEPAVRSAALQGLIKTGGDAPDLFGILRAGAKDPTSQVRATAIGGLSVLAGEDQDVQAEIAETALSDASAEVQTAALNALICCNIDRTVVAKVLKAACRSGAQVETRLRAMALLSQAWVDDPDVLLILKTSALSDPEPEMRSAAIKHTARITRGDPEVLSILKHAGVSDASIDVRRAALSGLWAHWGDHQNIIDIFRSAMDGRKQERLAALEALSEEPLDGQGLPPRIKPTIKEIAETDDHAEARAAAVRVMAKLKRHEPGLKEFLKNRAREDVNWRVRREAVPAVAHICDDDPAFLDWLKQTARSDDHWPVRQAAIREMMRSRKDDPGAAEFLIERIKRDPFRQSHGTGDAPNPRRTALDALIMRFPDHPEALPLLRELAEHDPDAAIKAVAAKVVDFNLMIGNRQCLS